MIYALQVTLEACTIQLDRTGRPASRMHDGAPSGRRLLTSVCFRPLALQQLIQGLRDIRASARQSIPHKLRVRSGSGHQHRRQRRASISGRSSIFTFMSTWALVASKVGKCFRRPLGSPWGPCLDTILVIVGSPPRLTTPGGGLVAGLYT
jgi:hypothetical protein